MASKDWKKVAEDKTITIFRKGEEDNFLTITEQTYNPHDYGFDKPIDFIVGVGNHHTKHTEKHFKTKPPALKFAKEYMGKN